MTPTRELQTKLTSLRALASRHGLDGILLRQASSLAWITCGASAHVNRARSEAEAAALITSQEHHLFTNNIEAPRLESEEELMSQGWEFHVSPWFEKPAELEKLAAYFRLGADGYGYGSMNLSGEIASLRANLTPEEGERFRLLGRLCAEAMGATASSLWPGQTEYEIAAVLALEAERRGIEPIVNLIATDERIFRYRHPLPTDKRLERYAMLVLCGRRWGLVCSLTRLVHLGQPSQEIRRKAKAVAQVDSALIAATRPGRTLGELFRIAQEAYTRTGYPDEWRLHHQGGPAGYEARECVATPGSQATVALGQVYAWNPSITGTKSEDTILIGEQGNEVLTVVPGWPTTPVEAEGMTLERPAILVVD